MKVINRTRSQFDGKTFITYEFDTGHQFRQYVLGAYIAYTPRGNYASTPTTLKLMRLASQYEDNRIQIQD